VLIRAFLLPFYSSPVSVFLLFLLLYYFPVSGCLLSSNLWSYVDVFLLILLFLYIPLEGRPLVSLTKKKKKNAPALRLYPGFYFDFTPVLEFGFILINLFFGKGLGARRDHSLLL